MEGVTRVVVRKPLHERSSDADYWRSQPPAARIAMVEELRRLHEGWDDGARPELRRVHRVTSLDELRANKRASGRTQDLADQEALESA